MTCRVVTLLIAMLSGVMVYAQSNDPIDPQAGSTAGQTSTIRVEPMERTPTYRVSVVSRTTPAVNYRAKSGTTSVKFQGTDLMPGAEGNAKVEGKSGRLGIEATLKRMQPASRFGPEYLTYVLWAITPQGRANNLGEIIVDKNGNAHTTVSSDLQAFGMVITAEPYFAVTRPSNLVVAENVIDKNTKGWALPIDAKFDALQRGEYTVDIPVAQLPSITAKPNTPIELLEARNAVAIAKAAGADRYASDTLAKAQDFLNRGEQYLQDKQNEKAIATVARGATQQAEDARLLTIQKKRQEQIAAEREAQRRSVEEARANAEAANTQARDAEQRRLAAEQAQEQARQEAERARLERQQADAARQAALQQQQQLQMQAQQAEQGRREAERQREELRSRLQQQLNTVLETRQTARGLIVNMSDVLFDTNKATLKPGAKVRLAKVAGIIMAYPDLHLQIEGFTDSTGTPEYNQSLSERRAATVRDYLISQGVPLNNVMARGYGQADPVASNATAQGRQLNRRVDLVVSGEAIGVNTAPSSPGAESAGTTGTSGVNSGVGPATGSSNTGSGGTSGSAAAAGASGVSGQQPTEGQSVGAPVQPPQ